MTDYRKIYQEKLMTAYEAAMKIRDNVSIFTDLFTAGPKTIFEAINQRCIDDNIHGCKMSSALDLYPLICYTDPKYQKNIQYVSQFCSGLTRKAVGAGYADYIPATYWDFPAMIEKEIKPQVLVVSVSDMDEEGKFSTGLTGSSLESYLKVCDTVIVEVNKKMPYAPCGPKISVKDVTAICEADYDLPVLPAAELDETSKKIGALIAERINDGACLQLGIGAIPDAVGMALKDKKHLGIHTEMLTDSMIELINCGAVDNSLKEIYTGQTATTFAFGSKRIYDYVDHNDKVVFLPVNVVNCPYVIAKNSNMVSVNAALEVDFMGQVCAESIGYKQFSGSGGQLDYVQGATMSKNGQSFIAFASTAKNGTISKIKPMLTPGSAVTTSRNSVDMIVTEYGIAKLRGRSLWQRTEALINIAHPDFRDELKFEAHKMGFGL